MQTPKGWRWLNRLSPSTWVIYGLSVDQLGQNHEMMTAPGGEQQTVAEFLKSYFGYEYSQRWCVPAPCPPLAPCRSCYDFCILAFIIRKALRASSAPLL